MPDEKPIDAAAPATGEKETPDSAGSTVEAGESTGAAEKERTDWKGLALTYKGKAERLNDVEKELQELRQRAAMPPTGYAADPQYQARIEAEKTLANLRLTAAQGDPASQAILMKMQEDGRVMHDLRAEIELSRLPEADRASVEKYWQSGDFRTVAAARKAYLGDQLETREKEREAQSQRERERREAERAKNSSPDTATRSVSAPGANGAMKESEWLAELKAAREKGDFARLKELRSPKVESNLAPG